MVEVICPEAPFVTVTARAASCKRCKTKIDRNGEETTTCTGCVVEIGQE